MSLLAFLGGAVNELGNQFHEERTRTRKAEDDEIERRRGYLESLYGKMMEDPTLSSRHPEYYGQALKDIMTLSQAQGQPRKSKSGGAGFLGGTRTEDILVPFLNQALSGQMNLFGGDAPGGAGAPGPAAPPGPAGPLSAGLTPPPGTNASAPTSGSVWAPHASVFAPPPQASATGFPAPAPVHFGPSEPFDPGPVQPPMADSVRRGGTPPPARFNGLDFSQVRTGPPALGALPGPVAPVLPPPPGTPNNYLLTSPAEKQRLLLEAQLRAQHAVRTGEFNDKVDELVRAGMPKDEAMQVAAGVPLASWVKSDNDPVKDPKSPTGWSTVVYNAKDPIKTQMVPAPPPVVKPEDKLTPEMQNAFLRVTNTPIATMADLVKAFPDPVKRNQAIDSANALLKSNRGTDRPAMSEETQVRLGLAESSAAERIASDYRRDTQLSTSAILFAEQAKTVMDAFKRQHASTNPDQRIKLDSRIALDQVIINALNKIIDPQSVVRQSEYARTPEGQAILERIPGYFQQLVNGGSGLSLKELQTVYDVAQLLVEGHKRYKYGQGERTITNALASGLLPGRILSQEDLRNTYEFMATDRLKGKKPGEFWTTPDRQYTYFINSQGRVMMKPAGQ